MPDLGRQLRAVDQLTRMSAAEPPPDEKGHRDIWHHSADADLTSHVDHAGRVLRQELRLLDDFLVWHHGARLRTGTVAAPLQLAPPKSAEARFDASLVRERVERARDAFEDYEGTDPYLQHFAAMLRLSHGFGAAAVVTRPSHELLRRRFERNRRSADPQQARRKRLVYLAVGAGAVALLSMWLSHGK